MKTSPTFRHTMPLFNCWSDGKMVSNDFIEVCGHAGRLTLDMDYLREAKSLGHPPYSFRTCFKEIYVVSPVQFFNPDYEWLWDNIFDDYSCDYSDLLNRMVSELEATIMDWWNPNRVHIMMHSAGHDSRLVSAILKKLEGEHGREWLGEVKFICAKPEQKEFTMLMRHLGYRPDQYLNYNENAPLDGYRRYTEDTSESMSRVSGFESYITAETALFREACPEETWKEIDYIEATIMNYLTAYPIPKAPPKHIYCKNPKVNGFIDSYYNTYGSRWMTTFLHRFSDFLVVGNQYQFIDLATRIPNRFKGRVNPNDPNNIMDKVRRDICELVSPGIMNVPLGRATNFRQTTDKESSYLRRLYRSSRFYQRFAPHLEMVKEATPWILDGNHLHTFDQSMLSLAAIHDRLFNEGVYTVVEKEG